MKLLLEPVESKVWIFLTLITGLSWILGANHDIFFQSVATQSALLVLLAFYKVRLIMQYFMEVRHASVLLRLGCEAWLICSCVMLVIFCYRLS